MIKKQDIAAPRTVQDMERRYKFGKTFAETMGLAKEASKAAEKAEDKVDSLDSEAVFNLLTENGTKGGFFIGNGENGTVEGDIYINAEYIKAGIVAADEMKLPAAGPYWFDGMDSLLEWIKPVAQSMTPNTQKTYSVSVEDSPVYGAGTLTLSRGYNGDGFDEVMAELNVDAYRCVITGYSEGGDGTLYWENWKITSGEDAVIEQGTDGIWKYQKWNSGKIELWTESISHTVSYSTISNYLYLSSFTVTVPLVTSVTYANIQETDWHYAQWTTTTRNSTNQIACRYYSANTNGSGKTYTFMAHVIGTWK